MNYNGYTAKIEFDERDNIFVGRLLGMRTMISFHGDTVVELRQAFESAVNEFLADCEEQGVKPEKPAYEMHKSFINHLSLLPWLTCSSA
jgi:predicted HicB family RNase H-like nuclease